MNGSKGVREKNRTEENEIAELSLFESCNVHNIQVRHSAQSDQNELW